VEVLDGADAGAAGEKPPFPIPGDSGGMTIFHLEEHQAEVV